MSGVMFVRAGSARSICWGGAVTVPPVGRTPGCVYVRAHKYNAYRVSIDRQPSTGQDWAVLTGVRRDVVKRKEEDCGWSGQY